MPGIIGTKIGMTRLILDDGRVIPLTVIQCLPNEVVQVKTVENDGYPAVVLGFDKLKKPSKNRKFRQKREFRISDDSLKLGDAVNVAQFEEGERVKITSISKGKGFQGVIKRHNFSRGPETHGSHHHREPGSIGASARPGRVHKGKKMPGRMGTDQKTLMSVEIVMVDLEKNIIGLKGPVAGSKSSLIVIRKT
jgi:large subunit ribosomal protein L3